MITRLRAWGCSFTWGVGLDSPKPLWRQQASVKAWPSLVAAGLGIDSENHAEPGASNVWIADQIISASFTSSDLVIVMWTWPERTTRNMQQVQHQHILANSRSQLFEHWLRVHTESDIRAQDRMFRMAAAQHLESLQVPFIQLDVLAQTSSWADLPLGLDHCHPGPEWHERIKGQILRELESRGYNYSYESNHCNP